MKKIFVLSLVLALSACSANEVKKVSEMNFPVYGNYCGPKYPPAGSTPVPVDEVDNACKKHDGCYEENGYFNQECDRQIIADLKMIKPKTPQEKLSRKLIIAYFSEALKIQK